MRESRYYPLTSVFIRSLTYSFDKWLFGAYFGPGTVHWEFSAIHGGLSDNQEKALGRKAHIPIRGETIRKGSFSRKQSRQRDRVSCGGSDGISEEVTFEKGTG